jgi:rod shape determining protein RodA
MSVIFLAGLHFRYFIIAFIICLLMVPIIWGNLHNYQKQRVKTFLNPSEDELGAGYNITQAKIAIGSGGVFGKGVFEGTQGSLDFLPESHTDFAFTIFAEQFGFFGCIILIALYLYLLYFGFSVSLNSESHFIRLASGGLTCLIFLHIMINLAMTSGLIPVVGNPLPLISYGGTFLISTLCCLAMLLNFEINKAIIIHSSKESYMSK